MKRAQGQFDSKALDVGRELAIPREADTRGAKTGEIEAFELELALQRWFDDGGFCPESPRETLYEESGSK